MSHLLKKLTIVICLCFSILLIDNQLVAVGKDPTVDEWLNKEPEQSDQPATDAPIETDDRESESLSFPIIKMLAALAFIVFLIYSLAKFVNKRTRSFQDNRALETLSGISVGQNRSIQIVKVGDHVLVVGVSDSIQLLKEISDEDEVEKILQQHTEKSTDEDIISKSKQWLQNRKSSNSPNSQSFTALLDQQLKKMTDKRKEAYNDVEIKESRDE